MNPETLWVATGEHGWRSPEISSEILAHQGLAFNQNNAVVLAQEQFDQDVIADFGNAMAYFIESGQVWALIIGFVLGYLLRGVTTYR
ncbi:MAG: hypothetical protein AAF609_21985 [Cyanobacteria bacterium P01_C01_bin.120]